MGAEIADEGGPVMPRLRDVPLPPGTDLVALAESALAAHGRTGRAGAPAPAGHGMTVAGGGWRRGVKVRLGDAAFLLQDTVLDRSGPGHELRRARARQLSPVARDVWLVQALAVRPTPAARLALDDVAAQGLFMARSRVLPGLPCLIDTVPGPGSVTLVVALPDARPLPETLGGPPYPCRVLDLLWRGLPALCAVLDALHARGLAHRALRADALLYTVDGRIVPRDLGRAAFAAVPGDEPGPAADVRDLAALIYEAVTGLRPGNPAIPPGLLRPDAADLDDVLLPALDPDPRARPPLARMSRRLRTLAIRGIPA
ncbi:MULTISPECIES: protein kinase family protein [Catenuloplanes]|uniref:Protein kinase domain-containing protein n=1 Tax=Catenuloplanes niger TaxID=587534 RepID=A0AAE3ZNV6_9ACTN|nr:hypothetical protein [Catenuloplanes niger]MDR7322337.1 hypothetical protein [Catenuloplanes niger]